jgi:predicted Zn-dependent protease
MDESGPSKKAILIAVGALVVVPAVSLIAVILNDRPETPSSPAAEPAQAVEPPHTEQPAPSPPPAQPIPRRSTLSPVQPASAAVHTASSQAADDLALARRIENTDPKRARELLREALQKDPNNELALEDLSGKMLADENWPEARDLAKRCNSVNARNRLCEKLTQLAPPITPEVEQVASVMDQCVKATPDNVGCLYGKAHWLFINGKAEDAEPLVQRLNELNPKAPEALMALGRMKAAGGSYGEARQLLQSACGQGNEQACFRADLLRGEGW